MFFVVRRVVNKVRNSKKRRRFYSIAYEGFVWAVMVIFLLFVFLLFIVGIGRWEPDLKFKIFGYPKVQDKLEK